jgi:translation initiation factor 3 subunit E
MSDEDDGLVDDPSCYDLTHKVSPFLDRHMLVPVLDFLKDHSVYDEKDITKAKIDVVVGTCMIDFALDMYNDLGEEVPSHLEELKTTTLEKVQSAQQKALPLLQILENEEDLTKIKTCKSTQEICDAFPDLEPDFLDTLWEYARLLFDCGNYELVAILLRHYRSLTMSQDADRPVTEKQYWAFWGLLASCILHGIWDEAATQVIQLEATMDSNSMKMSKTELVTQKAWLLHWAAFIIFKSEKGSQPAIKLLDLFLAEKNLSIISISCPHLFRYVATCLILHKRLKHMMKDTVAIIHYECSERAAAYKDPITQFITALYIDMDFDEAQKQLKKCKQVLEVDYFLKESWDEFEENARLLIFETYCRIHQCINIHMLASRLNMKPEEAELWIVKLIQSAKLDARIDSEKSRILMAKQPPNVYQQVMERTKNLAFRSTMILSNLDKAKGKS